MKGYYLSTVNLVINFTKGLDQDMINNIMLFGLLIFGSQSIDFPQIWQKVEGEWSYIGQIKEKTQILVWIEKKTKSSNNEILIKEIKKMPFITLSPKGKVVEISPLP